MNKQYLATWIVVVVTLTVSANAVASRREQDELVQRLTEIDGRVLRIERVINNQSLLNMAQQSDDLQNELRALRGQLEELQHTVELARNQGRDAIADLDKRVQALESARAVAPVASAAPMDATAAGPGAAATVSDRDAYQAAIGLLKDSKYPEAIAALTQFMSNYPQSALLDNAQYWLGEAHYVGKDYAQSQRDFQAVLDKYPNSGKAPDALLKLGFTQYELKNFKDARASLNRVVTQYPDSNAAKFAQQRLAKMSAEGQ